MKNTILYGNGINLLSTNSVSWKNLLHKLMGENKFKNDKLPNTMIYERIFMSEHKANRSEIFDELTIKNNIASTLAEQEANDVFKLLSNMDFENYLTTNYDYAIEKSFETTPEKMSSEEIYSLRRKRKYETINGIKYLWNIHGEIENPKSIMLGLDHYCGSVSKIDSYVKGTYKHFIDGKLVPIDSMKKKLKNNSFCHTSWVDLFFSSDVHIIGLSLDYSETDLWWILNKRARFSTENLVTNNITFYVDCIEDQKKELLEAFNINIVTTKNINNYEDMYRRAISKMLVPKNTTEAA